MADVLIRTITASEHVTARSVPQASWSRHIVPARVVAKRQFVGRGRIAGTVAEKGTPNNPVKRRVRLYQDRDGLLVRETWSDPTTGAYTFDYIDEALTYTVLTFDHTLNFRAVVADRITPEIMP